MDGDGTCGGRNSLDGKIGLIWMFPKIVGFPPKSSILIGFSIIFAIHFGGSPLFFGNTHFTPKEPTCK